MRHRRSIRLPGYDYTESGAYFVTICCFAKRCLFGAISDGSLQLSLAGHIATRCWLEIPLHFPRVELDAFVIMPNHMHGIVVLLDNSNTTDAQERGVPFGPRPGSIAAIIGAFKSATTRDIKKQAESGGRPVWQRNYYEHVIRNDEDLDRVRQYIENNPQQWDLDPENPM